MGAIEGTTEGLSSAVQVVEDQFGFGDSSLKI